MLQNGELSPIAEHHSIVALIASLVGLLFELIGGILLGVEDYFKHRDWEELKIKLHAMKHPALQGIPWFGVITNSTDDLAKILESLELKHNQTRARSAYGSLSEVFWCTGSNCAFRTWESTASDDLSEIPI